MAEFRYFTLKEARIRGISGEVWNRSDGCVEAIAEHPDQAMLDEFAVAIEAGPGYIRDLQIEPTIERGHDGFEVGLTR